MAIAPGTRTSLPRDIAEGEGDLGSALVEREERLEGRPDPHFGRGEQ